MGRQKRVHLLEFPIFTSNNVKLWPHKVNSTGNFYGWRIGASGKSDCQQFRAGEGLEFGEKKKEDNEGVLFYLLLASVMHRGGRNRCGKKWRRSGLCRSRPGDDVGAQAG